MISARIATLLALVVVLGASGLPARSADTVKFTDPAGDALDGRASMDIVSAEIGIKPLPPRATPSLYVTLELAAPAEPTGAAYEFVGEIAGCGGFGAAARQGTAYNIVFGEALGLGISTHQMRFACGEPPDETGDTSTFVDLMTEFKDNKVTMWTAVNNIPKEARATGVMTGLRAFTQVVEPATGIVGNGSLGLEPHDEATTAKPWKFA